LAPLAGAASASGSGRLPGAERSPVHLLRSVKDGWRETGLADPARKQRHGGSPVATTDRGPATTRGCCTIWQAGSRRRPARRGGALDGFEAALFDGLIFGRFRWTARQAAQSRTRVVGNWRGQGERLARKPTPMAHTPRGSPVKIASACLEGTAAIRRSRQRCSQLSDAIPNLNRPRELCQLDHA